MKLLSVGTNAKTVKSDKRGEYLTAIMYLAPYNLSGHQVCPKATKGCAAACLNTAGRGAFSNVQKARIAKTQYFFKNKRRFIEHLEAELEAHRNKCRKHRIKPAVRLNGTSDIVWEVIAPELFYRYPDVQFYDYTKIEKRVVRYLMPKGIAFREVPENYHLTLSYSGINEQACITALGWGHNVSVVFRTKDPKRFPKTWHGFPVLNGDEHDLRFLDKPGHVVGLTAKGKAMRDSSGFVVDV